MLSIMIAATLANAVTPDLEKRGRIIFAAAAGCYDLTIEEARRIHPKTAYERGYLAGAYDKGYELLGKLTKAECERLKADANS